LKWAQAPLNSALASFIILLIVLHGVCIMPKVLVAGEKVFFIHSFTNDELNQLEISRTRNDSTYAIGSVLDDKDVTEDKMEAIKVDVMMMLKQSETWKNATRQSLKSGSDEEGFSLLVFRGKNINAKKNYIATWCGQSKAEMLSQNPNALIRQMVQGFHQLFNSKDYHKKSQLHALLAKA
jgi:hypothetical protein